MYHHFKPEEFAERRKRFIEIIGENSAAIFVATPEKIRSHDTQFKYRASSDIIYLTGFEEPETVVVFAPGYKDEEFSGDFFMFVRPRDPAREQWDGFRAGTLGAEEKYGADRAFVLDDLQRVLPKLLTRRENLLYTQGDDQDQTKPFDDILLGILNKMRHQRYTASTAPQNLIDARNVVHTMRLVKDEEELRKMRRAGEISAMAHKVAMRCTKPNIWEYQVQAHIEYEFMRHGASGPAYASIVGSGNNATILHYIENDCRCYDGDILLIDAGAEYEYYAGDITRSFPVNGRFTPAQRDVYEVVLDVELSSIDKVRKGTPYNDIKRFATKRLTEGLVSLGILQGSLDMLLETRAYAPFYPHSIGHYLGLDVHDVGGYFDKQGGDRELEPGMVVTIEPGLYFQKDDERVPEAFRGIGIRIEDDIVCTEGDPEVLSADAPKTISEIEELVGSAYA